jgi:putative hydrolase of the HAD superfamily
VIDDLSPPPKGVLFDYGNTLIPFGQREMDAEGGALVSALARAMPGVERDRIADALREVRLAKFRHRRETMKETDPRDVVRRIAKSFGHDLDPEQVEAAMDAHLAAFREVARTGPGVHETLTALRDRGLRLGLVSNYSHSESIHATLDDLGLRPCLDAVVISGELGIVKPHPEIFLAGARSIGLSPGEILFVGDNARLDILGTALTTEHLGGAYHFERPGEDRVEVTPDLVLTTLGDLVRED